MHSESIIKSEDENKKKRQLNNTNKADKHHSLRRDLLLSNFDKTMTVEKARFDPIEESVITQPTPLLSTSSIPRSTDTAIPNDDIGHSPPRSSSLPLSPSTVPTLSKTVPTLSKSASTGTLNSVHSLGGRRLTPVKSSEGHTRKKLKKPLGTASPAEVFHRNLVDAVSNVEDSDENEHYVYPYSGNESDHRPMSIRSMRRKDGLGQWLKRALNRKNSFLDREDEEEWLERRPRLRSHVQNPTSNGLLTRWHNRFNKAHPTQYYAIGGYTSDEEDAPLVAKRQQKRVPKANNKKVVTTFKNLCRYIISSTLLITCLFALLIFYSAKPLTDMTVDIDRVLATDKELIFDLKVNAENWNWWTIHVADADISVFAFSQIVPTTSTLGVDPAEYLGSFSHFDEPLRIKRRGHVVAISQIRVKSPGADASGNERWSRMIRYPYGLVVRGVLKYKSMPLRDTTSVAICNVTQVDPTTGSLSNDQDKNNLCIKPNFLTITRTGL